MAVVGVITEEGPFCTNRRVGLDIISSLASMQPDLPGFHSPTILFLAFLPLTPRSAFTLYSSHSSTPSKRGRLRPPSTPRHLAPMSLNNIIFLLLLALFPLLLPGLPNPDTASIQPFKPNPSPPATIPAFPEQSNLAGCPLDLPNELFHGINSACGSGSSVTGNLHRTRCCPVLAAWLYSAYSATALSRANKVIPATDAGRSPSYDMPLLPDDSETCVDGLSKGLKEKGIELFKPNETCDVVYCYCGIRLHPLSCPEAFSLNQKGKLVGDKRVEKLERYCLSNSNNVNGFPGLGGCSKCLNSLYLLNNKKALNSSKSEDRTTRMHNKDCQLMGLTWLLAKNRAAYIHTVTAVLRAMMMSIDGSDPRSCTLSSDGMPLAVDSSEISNNSLSISHQAPIYVTVAVICLSSLLHLVPSAIF